MSSETPAGKPSPRFFLVFVVAIATIAFLWLVAPFSGAILWAVIAAVLFDPLNSRLLKTMPKRRNMAALATLLVIIVVVVVPAILLGAALVREAMAFYTRLRTGEIDPARLFVEMQGHLPGWINSWLTDIGLSDVGGLRDKLGRGLASSFQTVAAQVFSVGLGTLGFFLALGVMLYLTFFLLRDGHQIATRIEQSVPLAPDQRSVLIAKFSSVIRATIKGSLIVAALQGTTGGLIFWALGIPSALLWGVAMGVFSLFPAVGTGLIWVPVTIYLLVSGQVWQAVVLGSCGFLIISSIDNVVRPILVGRDARMPDYVVLLATLGGFEMVGFNGFIVGPVIAALFMAVWDLFGAGTQEAGAAETLETRLATGGH
jgi:predicted PurR-regulated permease PerM